MTQDTAINIIDWNDMLQMIIDDGDTVDGEAIQQKRQDFCRRIQNSGGWCVVRLDKVAATVVNDMWKCIETLFINQENDEHGLIRGFSLADASANSKLSNDKRQSGYLHVQTQLLHDHQLVPRSLKTLVGPCGMEQAASAFQLMSQLCKTFTSVVNSGERCPRDAAVLRDRLLYEMDSTLYDEPWMSGTYHRLCQYVSGELQTEIDDDTSTGRRLLRSHCDWTIATALPVSAIPGLELYDPSTKRWIRIEQVLAGMHHSNATAADAASEHNWNSQYAVVITGSWLELLTKGETKATVHRVISDPTCREQRMSAPFFMRPRESLFRQVDQEFNRAVVDDCDALDYRQAMHKLGDYLAQQ
ncbi:hypothetical protein MPSEU_000557600 [Mayamaea pseudoterrestris]|nr:hypothetical protein MPSEU_000557600 [Mayamaea pseudoterrestris]